MALVYVGVMILLAVSWVDVVYDASFPIFLGVIFCVFAGAMKIWRVVSR